LKESINSSNKISISHFVGLSGVGGVQRNFFEYINNQAMLGRDNRFIHKIYTLGKVDIEYSSSIDTHNIGKFKNFLMLVSDIVSKSRVVHFYNNLTSLKLLILLFLLPATNVILHERGSIWNYPSSRRLLLRFVAWKACLILTNSNATKIMLEKKFHISNKKIRVLHNGIDVSTKYTSKKIDYIGSKNFRIGFIGRLDTPKGVHVLIDAMRNLSENDIELIIAGDGVLESALKEYSTGLKKIHFIGRIIEPYSFLSSLDLLVVPSIREPLGNVCLEAGFCGVPVLASNIDGIPEIIENKISGELITPTQKIVFEFEDGSVPLPEFVVDPLTKELSYPKQIDPRVLSSKILYLSNSDVLLCRYRRNLYKKVNEYFNINRYTDELHDIYFEVHKGA
jgi:glycosyltransferase involved in cell wall biosynthesis